MSMVLDAIEAKKNGQPLSAAMIEAVVGGFVQGNVPDYQMSALLMAIRCKGLSFEETIELTRVMANSGPRFSFPHCVDKHSTGGVGDKVTMTSLPLVAACGVPVAKLSGRGLGTTGGTIDKLESIPGWSADLAEDAFARQVDDVGLVVGAAGLLAPADGVIYALRDTTGTVDSLGLIASSIVSKKVATGAGHLLYDVKAGTGAFMKDLDQARELAELLVRLSGELDIRARAVITDMTSPLGSAVGNALEIREAVAFLRGEQVAPDLAEVAVDEAVRLIGLHDDRPDARSEVEQALRSGAGMRLFERFVAAQGGDPAALQDLRISSVTRQVTAGRGGHVAGVDALRIARAALALGAGRQTKADRIDHSVGVEVHVRVGDAVAAGQSLATVYGERDAGTAHALTREAIEIGDEPVEPGPHILAEVG